MKGKKSKVLTGSEWGVLAVTVAASGMAFLDSSIVNIAVPTIQSTLRTDITGIQWVLDSYRLVLASCMMAGGSFGDRFGRKKIFIIGIAVFGIGSLFCAFSGTITLLIWSRVLQGLGAALMIPGSLSILNTTIPQERRGVAIGIWSGLSGAIAAAGPFVGGWLVEQWSWQSVFFINLPLCVMTLVLSGILLSESYNPLARSFDYIGALLIAGSLLGISYALIHGPTNGWPGPVLAALVVGIVFFVLFLLWMFRAEEPLVPPKLFSSSMIIGANIATLFLYFALNGVIFFLVLNMQQVQHMLPSRAGLSLLPPIVLITFLSGWGGKLADTIGPRLPMVIGPLLVGIGMASFILPGKDASYFREFFPGLVVFGIGMSLVIAPLTKAALMVKKEYSGIASGVNNAVAGVSALMAIALLGAIAFLVFSSSLQQNLSKTHLPYSLKQEIRSQAPKLAAIEIPASYQRQERQEAADAVAFSFIAAFRVVMGICAALALLSSAFSFFLIKKDRKGLMEK